MLNLDNLKFRVKNGLPVGDPVNYNVSNPKSYGLSLLKKK